MTLVFGFGVPLDLYEESVTFGYVVRISYHVPENTTIFKQAHLLEERGFNYGKDIYERTDADKDATDNESNINKNNKEIDKTDSIVNDLRIKQKINNPVKELEEDEELTDLGNTEIIIESDENDTKDDVDVMIEEFEETVEDENKNIFDKKNIKEFPSKDDENDQKYDEAESNSNKKRLHKLSRWELYEIFEVLLEQKGFPGRACLLRTICEASNTPFMHGVGLLGEMMHVIFTPSSTTEKLSSHLDNEYFAAENIGKMTVVSCQRMFHECSKSPLDLISKIYMDDLYASK